MVVAKCVSSLKCKAFDLIFIHVYKELRGLMTLCKFVVDACVNLGWFCEEWHNM